MTNPLYSQLLKAIEDGIEITDGIPVENNIKRIDDKKIAKACQTISEEWAKGQMIGFAEWAGNRYQKFHDKWTAHCENVYETTNPFYTTDELIQLYKNSEHEKH